MTPIHLRDQFWGIEVPEDAINFEITRPFNRQFYLSWGYPDPLVSSGIFLWYESFGGKKMYPAQLEIVCLSKEVTAQQASEISGVKETIVGTEFVSFSFLLADKGLDPDNCLILKKL
jgi:hypothetical protein